MNYCGGGSEHPDNGKNDDGPFGGFQTIFAAFRQITSFRKPLQYFGSFLP